MRPTTTIAREANSQPKDTAVYEIYMYKDASICKKEWKEKAIEMGKLYINVYLCNNKRAFVQET